MCTGHKYISMCCRKKETARLITMLTQLPDIEPIQRQALQYRYLRILDEFSIRCTRYAILYHVGHFIITVGSLLVPALLSIQYSDNSVNVFSSGQLQALVFWLTWCLSLLVTMFNGIIVLYKVDKKYFFLHTTRERLRSEGWQYFQLTGRYAGSMIHYKAQATHVNQFVFFCHYVEKIRMRQIEEEYYKHEESNQTTSIQNRNPQDATAATAAKELYPPSISADIDKIYDGALKDTPDTVKTIVTALIRSAKNKNSELTPLTESPPSPKDMEVSLQSSTNDIVIPITINSAPISRDDS